ncbi:hypothetical protein ACFWIA_33955, partial [Streptomyces sp. NPDC127068]|uniref:hypothetical protein n=1 Tax=Streptomyces sp. NPDC127068 TaxID=3347127 RepID=UPI0036570075
STTEAARFRLRSGGAASPGRGDALVHGTAVPLGADPSGARLTFVPPGVRHTSCAVPPHGQ